MSITEVEFAFRDNAKRFLNLLKIFSRGRKFILSFDETEDAFYGEFDKAEDNLYLHELTTTRCKRRKNTATNTSLLAITCNDGIRCYP